MTAADPTSSATNATRDLFLGGRITIYQARDGRHRSGSDAVLLAASLPWDIQGAGYDFGSGSGAAGLCVLARLAHTTIHLVDIDTVATHLASASLSDPINAAVSGRATVLNADISAAEEARINAGIARESADFVICNPPYYATDKVQSSAISARATAHVLTSDGLLPWIKAAASALRPGGLLALILRPEALPEMLSLMDRRFGDLLIKPLHPYPDAPASRLIVHGRKGHRGTPSLCPGHILRTRDAATGADSGYTDLTKAILRDGEGLPLTVDR